MQCGSLEIYRPLYYADIHLFQIRQSRYGGDERYMLNENARNHSRALVWVLANNHLYGQIHNVWQIQQMQHRVQRDYPYRDYIPLKFSCILYLMISSCDILGGNVNMLICGFV